MVILPIERKLRKKAHRSIALAQDILVVEIYNKFPDAVVHGGTAIWRCYGGNRFSEDVDIYLPLTAKKTIKGLADALRKRDFIVEKFKTTEKSVFAKFSYTGAVIRFEAVFKNIKSVTRHFEMTDGTSIMVNTLIPEELVKEKVLAYLARRKSRDLYDIFFLLEFIEDVAKIKDDLTKLVKDFKRPADEKELRTLIITGSIPTVENIMAMVRKWAK